MKKITLIFFMSLLSLGAYAQLAKEGFESWPPAGWVIDDNGIGLANSWIQSNATAAQPAFEGTYAAYINRETVIGIAEDWLITPAFNVPVNPNLKFYSRLTTPNDDGTMYRVMIIDGGDDPSDPANYELVEEWTELTINPSQQEYVQKIVELAAEYVGTSVRLAFVMAGNNGDRWLIDNVEVVEKCLNPTDLTATNIGLNTADLSWANPGGATSWEIELLLDGQPTTGTGTVYSEALPYTVNELTPNTNYRFYVRALCDDDDSDWMGPFTFSTIDTGFSCNAPIAISTLPYSTIDDTINYSDAYDGVPGEGCGNVTGGNILNGNDVVYAYTAGFTGTISINITDTTYFAGLFIYDNCDDIGIECVAGGVPPFLGTSVSIPEFAVTSGETYYIVISSQFDTTTYNLVIQQESCTAPEGLPVTGQTMTSALLSWTNPTGATAWEVVVQAPAAGIPAGSGEAVTTNTNYLVDGLAPATPFEYYVRANCGDGTFSAWAGPYLFNTIICEPADQCGYTFVLTETGGNSWNDGYMTVSQNGITIATLEIDPSLGQENVIVPLCDGFPFELFWTEGGMIPEETGIAILNPLGQTIYTKSPGTGTPGTLLYSGTADCDALLCVPPAGLTTTNTSLTSVQLDWDGPATGNWEYYITEEGEPAPDNDSDGELTTVNPVTVDGLTAATNYTYYVRMVCDGGTTSAWSNPYTFGTAVCGPENQCEYTFVMTSTSFAGYSGNTMTITQNGAIAAVIGSEFIIGDGPMEVTVPLCTDEPFEVFWNSGSMPWAIGLEIINPFEQTIYTMLPETLSPEVVLYSGTANCTTAACIPPVGLTAANATITTIDLGWDNVTGGAWEYYITGAGEPAPTEATAGEPAASNAVTAGGLTISTNYEYYVRLVCGDGTTSTWAGPFAFSTTVCEPEDKCIYTFEMTSEIGWGWEGTTMTIFQGGVAVATIGEEFSGGTSQMEIPLCPGIETEIFWNTGGSGDPGDKGLVIYTNYMETFFTKPAGTGSEDSVIFTGELVCDAPPCPKPQDLTATDATETSAMLGWTEIGTATNWEVWVLPSGSPEPTEPGTPVATPSHLAEGLSSGSAYVFYVRAVCGGDNGNSSWSGPFLFATVLENDTCATATAVPVNPDMECVEITSGVLNGATSSGITSECTWTTPTADVWYQFVATAETHSVSLTNFIGDMPPFHSIYANECDALTELYCGYDAGGSTVSGLTIGETYFVQVYLDGGASLPTDIMSFDICIYTPEAVSIIIDQNTYTVDEIVTDVLVSSVCGQVDNITWSTGLDHGQDSNGIAYFNRGSTSFPIKEGVVLVTGEAMQAKGPNNTTLGEGNWWPGDDELFDFLEESGVTPLFSINQSSLLEFDFVPVTNRIRFPFVFASEEYGYNQCQFTDAFAFFLTNEAGEVSNLAVIPGTETPVSVLNIRDEAFYVGEFPCPSSNPEYFGNYYGPGGAGLDPMTAPINFNGHTVVMYAEADVIPGQTYHIKMVIGDYWDTGNDSAVFIGPFDIGNVDLGLDLTVEDGNAVCAGEELTIESGLNPDDYTIEWLQDGEVIEGETGADLVVSEPGVYTVNVQYLATTCTGTDSVTVEFYAPVGDPVNLNACDPDGFSTFDLSANTAIILEGLTAGDYTVTYHETNDDAQENTGILDESYENTIANLQALYVRIENSITGCVTIKTFNLVVQVAGPEFTINDDFSICEGTTGTITVTPENFDVDDVTFSWTLNGVLLPDATSSITVNSAGDYEVTVNAGICTASKTVTVTVLPAPVADDPDDVSACVSYALPALSPGNTYYTGSGGTGLQLNPGDVITTTQEIFVLAQSTTVPVCTAENSFIVLITPTPEFSLGGPYATCGTGSVTIAVDALNFDPALANYVWTLNGTVIGGDGPTLTVTEHGEYGVTVSTGDCTHTETVAVTEDTTAIDAGFEEGCEGDNYILEVVALNGSFNADTASYSWTGPGAFTATGRKIEIVETGTYNVTIITQEGCVKEASHTINDTTCRIPRGISPNNDGLNDEFDLTMLDVRQLSIFNRYGQVVYSKSNYTNEWHGQGNNGDELPTGTYYYTIEQENGESRTGWVYINRQEN